MLYTKSGTFWQDFTKNIVLYKHLGSSCIKKTLKYLSFGDFYRPLKTYMRNLTDKAVVYLLYKIQFMLE